MPDMRNPSPLRLAALVASLAAAIPLAGCMVGPDYVRPKVDTAGRVPLRAGRGPGDGQPGLVAASSATRSWTS